MTESATLIHLLERVFDTVFPLVAIVSLGYLSARRAPEGLNMSVANRLNMDIFTPALIFSVMASKSFDFFAYLTLSIGAAAMVVGSGLLTWPLCRLLGVAPKTFVPPMMFNNCGNLGLPLALLAFGEAGLAASVSMFLVSNLLHFSLGTHLVNHNARWNALFTNPMIIATFVGLIWSLFKIPLPDFIRTPIDMLGQIAIPLMLFALGVRMCQADLKNWRIGIYGAILSPLSAMVIALPFAWLLELSDEFTAYLILFSALPPAVLNYMVAERYNQEPQTVASIVLIGNMAGLFIIPATLFFIL